MERKNLLVTVLLALLCIFVYGQTITCGWVNYDDPLYVTANPHVQAGLRWETVVWAFTTERAMYFHPLTWLSHALDCQVYNLAPYGHHLTNMLFHMVDSILLYFVLLRATRMRWPSAFAAALFAVHPLHVESVAWVSERKDVLSAFFWIATMGCYTEYRQGRGRKWLGAAGAMFFLGFMSKPMIVTLPFALLLMDYWPYGAIDRTKPLVGILHDTVRMALEKWWLFAMSFGMCAVTVIMQMRGHNLAFGEKVPLVWRCVNAVVVYGIYLLKTVWPTGLAIYYPHPITRPMSELALAGGALLVISGVCLWQMRRRPYLLVGWLWYLGTLLPVIELVQAGTFSHADRYVYLPHIGVFFMAAWGLHELFGAWRKTRMVFTAVVVYLFAATAFVQCTYWVNSSALFHHAMDVTPENPVAHNNYGAGLSEQGRHNDAIQQYERAVALDPGYALAIDNIGISLSAMGQMDAALAKHREALAIKPKLVAANLSLAQDLLKLKRYDEAEEHFVTALEREPDCMPAWCGRGELWAKKGDVEKAKKAYARALELNPKSNPANRGLGVLLADQGDAAGAAVCFARALKTGPEDAETYFNLGTVLQGTGRAAEAVQAYEEALRWDPGMVPAYINLGGLYAQAGRAEEELKLYRKAIENDPNSAMAHNNLAGALARRGVMAEAKEEFLAAIALDPGYVIARLNLAGLLLDAGDVAGARAQVEAVLAKDPADARALGLKAEAEKVAGK